MDTMFNEKYVLITFRVGGISSMCDVRIENLCFNYSSRILTKANATTRKFSK